MKPGPSQVSCAAALTDSAFSHGGNNLLILKGVGDFVSLNANKGFVCQSEEAEWEPREEEGSALWKRCLSSPGHSFLLPKQIWTQIYWVWGPSWKHTVGAIISKPLHLSAKAWDFGLGLLCRGSLAALSVSIFSSKARALHDGLCTY